MCNTTRNYRSLAILEVELTAQRSTATVSNSDRRDCCRTGKAQLRHAADRAQKNTARSVACSIHRIGFISKRALCITLRRLQHHRICRRIDFRGIEHLITFRNRSFYISQIAVGNNITRRTINRDLIAGTPHKSTIAIVSSTAILRSCKVLVCLKIKTNIILRKLVRGLIVGIEVILLYKRIFTGTQCARKHKDQK